MEKSQERMPGAGVMVLRAWVLGVIWDYPDMSIPRKLQVVMEQDRIKILKGELKEELREA